MHDVFRLETLYSTLTFLEKKKHTDTQTLYFTNYHKLILAMYYSSSA